MANFTSRTGKWAFTESATLTNSRNRLNALRAQRSTQAATEVERRAKLDEIRIKLLELETSILTGHATEAEAQGLRDEEAKVRREYEVAHDNRALDEAIRRIERTVNEGEQASKNEAREKLRAPYRTAVQRLAAALQAAAEASRGLEEFEGLLGEIGGDCCQWPRSWQEFKHDRNRPPGRESRLASWLTDAREYGLL